MFISKTDLDTLDYNLEKILYVDILSIVLKKIGVHLYSKINCIYMILIHLKFLVNNDNNCKIICNYKDTILEDLKSYPDLH